MAESDLQRFKRIWPDIKWDEPVKMTLFASDSGFACRICIAKDGIKGRQIKNLPKDPEEVRRHIQEVHAQ